MTDYTTLTAPAVLYDLDEADYHANLPCPEPSLSSTMAKTILQPGGPARLLESMTAPRTSTAAFDFGHAAHEMALGRGGGVVVVPAEFLTPSGKYTTRAGVVDELEAWQAKVRAEGATPLLPGDFDKVDRMAAQLLGNRHAAELLTAADGLPEVSMFGTDPITGRWLRGRIDHLASPSLIVDYKTATGMVDRATWETTSWKYGYHIQAAHYMMLGVALGVVEPDAEVWVIAQEKTAPHLVAVHRLAPDLLALGDNLVNQAIELWDVCLTTNEWPGLPDEVATISIPAWARRTLTDHTPDTATTPAPDSPWED